VLVRITRLLRSLIFISTCLASAVPSWTQSSQFPAKPDQENFYVDAANLIAEDVGQEINQIAASLLEQEDIALIVVTIPSMTAYGVAGYTIERYATDLFNEWGIGSEQRNYGILLLVSLGDRRARIELGAGWGLDYNRQSQNIMDSLIVPSFKEGAYGEGVLGGVRGLDAMARGLALPKPPEPWWQLPLTVGFFALMVLVIISLFRSGHKGWGWALIAFLGIVIFSILRSSASAQGSGGAFGGGSSGGGGASGSW